MDSKVHFDPLSEKWPDQNAWYHKDLTQSESRDLKNNKKCVTAPTVLGFILLLLLLLLLLLFSVGFGSSCWKICFFSVVIVNLLFGTFVVKIGSILVRSPFRNLSFLQQIEINWMCMYLTFCNTMKVKRKRQILYTGCRKCFSHAEPANCENARKNPGYRFSSLPNLSLSGCCFCCVFVQVCCVFLFVCLFSL